MAYTPVNWQTGDTITADRLNRMDRGWDVVETELFSETVTTVVDSEHPDWGAFAQLAYSQLIDADTIIVTFDGTEYTCPRTDSDTYGAPWTEALNANDFSVYPFYIFSNGSDPAGLVTQTAGEHTVSVAVSSLETSADFDAAVNKAAVFEDSAFEVISGTTTWQEVHDALMAGKYVYTATEYGDSGNDITSVGHALRTVKTSTQGYDVMFVEFSGVTNPSVGFFYLGASSADGVLS